MVFKSSERRTIFFNVPTQWGDFYKGSREMFEVDGTFKRNKYYALSADMKYNTISSGDRKFKTKEYGGRLQVVFLRSFFQALFFNGTTKQKK